MTAAPLRRMRIGTKLNLGFGVLVLITLVVIGLSYLASERATTNMTLTTDLRAPSTLASSRAQADLLKMVADVRGYLVLGEESYRTGYLEARQRFAQNLAILEELADADNNGSAISTPQDYQARLVALRHSFEEWSRLPEQLFALHDDQLEREPGLRMLIKEGNRPIAQVVVAIKKILETQQQREPTAENLETLGEMAAFQASFFAMVAGLRGYVTTARENFKFEYNTNLAINERAMNRLLSSKLLLSTPQQRQLELISRVREGFVSLPEKIFEWVDSERRRMDLYLFRTKAVPPADTMLTLLGDITADQQGLLQADLTEGRMELTSTQNQLLATGVAAFLLALVLAYVFRANIVGPIQRLTGVAQRVGSGDLTAVARYESRDEIGTLAQTFNDMNTKLRASLEDLEQRRLEQEKSARTFQRQSEYLSALHDTTLGLISRLDLTELLSDLTTRAGQLLDTPHGYIYLVNSENNKLERKVGVGVYRQSIGFHLEAGEGVAGKVWTSGEPLVVNQYDSWEGRTHEISYETKIRAIMGVPLKSGDEVIGVLGMACDFESNREFGEEEAAILDRFAQLASISLDNARLYTAAQEAMRRSEQANERISDQNRMLESLSTRLSKYLSPQVYSSIFSGDRSVEISSQRKKLTIFFSDIADFTATTDSLESEELTGLLNHYLTEMSRIALEHGATIDKYVGDAVMAFFGDPESRGTKEDALACVRMAIAMQRRMRELQSEWRDLGAERPFRLRIGINTGYCTVGNFGSEDRMDYTIIGNEVNLAARLQAHADLGSIIIAHETYSLVKEEIHAEEQDSITVKGFTTAVRNYKVIGIYDNLVEENRFIHRESDGLKVTVDLSRSDKTNTIRTLEEVLERLKDRPG